VPNIGIVAQVEKVAETKVEMICVGRGVMERSVAVLKEAHPKRFRTALLRWKMFDLWKFDDMTPLK
jgi:hypothetical protein